MDDYQARLIALERDVINLQKNFLDFKSELKAELDVIKTEVRASSNKILVWGGGLAVIMFVLPYIAKFIG